MGLVDKMKEQAATATAAAKEVAQKGQSKFEDMQAKRAADAILRDLGAAYYAQWTERGSADTPAEIERLVAALRQHEEEHGPIDLKVDSSNGSAS